MQNEPRQIIYTRPPATPKLKNDWLTIVVKLLLFGSIFFCNYFSGIGNYNSLFAYVIDATYGYTFTQATGMSIMQLMSMFESGAMAAAIKVVSPLITSLIVFLFYILYAKFFAYLVFNQSRVLEMSFDIRKFRICLDCSVVLLALLMGVSRYIFYCYPLASNMGEAIVDPLIAIIALATFFFAYTRGMEKKYYPILLNVMLIPAIILVIVV